MGLFRLFLATTVVIAHSSSIFGLTFIGGAASVQIFFIISGFYMGLVLNEKYSKNNVRAFYINRFLKIFPMYLIVLIFITVLFLMSGLFFNNYIRLGDIDYAFTNFPIITLLYISASNLFLLFSDLSLFLGLNTDGNLFFTSDYKLSDFRVHKYLIIPQSWSLSIEIIFYVIAPFIARKNIKLIIFLILISFSIRILIYYYFELKHDPWTYRFVVTEFAYFGIGILSYRLYKSCYENLNLEKKYVIIIFSVFTVYILLGYQLLAYYNYGPIVKNGILFILTIFVIPLLFKCTKDSIIDYKIGELSYPIYIIHLSLVQLFSLFLSKGTFSTLCILFTSVILSIPLIKIYNNTIVKYKSYNI